MTFRVIICYTTIEAFKRNVKTLKMNRGTMRKHMKKRIGIKSRNLGVFMAFLGAIILSGCSSQKEEVIIYTSAEDYRIEYLSERLEEEFPEYDIAIEYMSTGNHAAKLMAEGSSTACDISYDLEYGYMAQLDEQGMFANLSEEYDMSIYSEDTVVSDNYVIEYRNGGAVILNMDVLSARGLQEPTSYEDLLKEEYKGLISMPNPKSSGTGYMFLRNLVNAWGEEEEFI